MQILPVFVCSLGVVVSVCCVWTAILCWIFHSSSSSSLPPQVLCSPIRTLQKWTLSARRLLAPPDRSVTMRGSESGREPRECLERTRVDQSKMSWMEIWMLFFCPPAVSVRPLSTCWKGTSGRDCWVCLWLWRMQVWWWVHESSLSWPTRLVATKKFVQKHRSIYLTGT